MVIAKDRVHLLLTVDCTIQFLKSNETPKRFLIAPAKWNTFWRAALPEYKSREAEKELGVLNYNC